MTKRIVSLVPSTTATLAYAGLKGSILGCTQFCVDPPNLHRTAEIVGGTKDPDHGKIQKLEPDLIFMNKEENRLEDYTLLEQKFTIKSNLIRTPFAVVKDYEELALTVPSHSETFLHSAKSLEQELEKAVNRKVSRRLKALYLIWKNPYMSIGHDTYINAMLEIMGFQNVIEKFSDDRYPVVSDQQIIAHDPEVILLSTEPYPFRKRDCADLQNLVPNAELYRADGKLFSWHGYHTMVALRELNANGDIFRTDLCRPFQ